jgi:hypothetical protein
MLAARGARDLDRGEDKIEDDKAAAALRGQARLLHLSAAAWAVILTIVALILFQRLY